MNFSTHFFLPAPGPPESNETAVRLGDWLFVPVPDLVVDSGRIQHQSPLRSSGTAAPVVSELYHTGGEAVYYSESKRRTLTVRQYQALLRQHPKTVKEDWRIRQSGMSAYGRGTVHHPDHHAITLDGWHRILIDESEPRVRHNEVLSD
jgi:hypothetical protein